MEKELLQRALDSILHGSTQIVHVDDGMGNAHTQTIQVGDLRPQLVESLAKNLANTDGFKQAFEKALTREVIDKIVKRATEEMKFSDMPYKLRGAIEEKLKLENVTFRKFQIQMEVIEKTDD